MDQEYLEIIIDGYNFLLTTGMMASPVRDSELEKGRRRLFRFLAESFPDPGERSRIVVVFDSRTAQKLPPRLKVDQIRVHFSQGYDSADEMIIEMIRQNHVPKRLLVVSSDHEIQTAARRRKAAFVDSDRWLDQLEATTERIANSLKKKPGTADGKDEDGWLEKFTLEMQSAEAEPARDEKTKRRSAGSDEPILPAGPESSHLSPSDDGSGPPSSQTGTGTDSENFPELDEQELKELDELIRPTGGEDFFPPGYGEDLLE